MFCHVPRSTTRSDQIAATRIDFVVFPGKMRFPVMQVLQSADTPFFAINTALRVSVFLHSAVRYVSLEDKCSTVNAINVIKVMLLFFRPLRQIIFLLVYCSVCCAVCVVHVHVCANVCCIYIYTSACLSVCTCTCMIVLLYV